MAERSIGLISEVSRQIEYGRLRRIGVAFALCIPAVAYFVLGIVMPLQYRYVLLDASDRVYLMVYAILILIGFALCVFWTLRSHGLLTLVYAVLASASPITACATILIIVGPTSANLTVTVIAVVMLFVGYWQISLGAVWTRLPIYLKSAWTAPALALAVYFSFGLASIVEPVMVPRFLGSLAVFAVFVGTFGVLACLASIKLRFAFGCIGYCLLASFLFSANDHRIPLAQASSTTVDLSTAFIDWLRERRDLEEYRSQGRPYPVVFVSSEGGGIYATAHAYSVLSVLASHCPTFSQHVFATVGVSGGAFGNALFASSVDPEQKPYSSCQPNAGRAVDSTPVVADHLSPVLARFLLVEPVDRLIPGKWIQRDRGQVLADSFLSVASDRNYLSAAISDTFNSKSARPVLVSVAMDMANGRRFVMAPVQPNKDGVTAEWWPGDALAESYDKTGQQISVLNAAGLSARFPWITPTGRLSTSNNEDVVLTDGGYFDNSGADTVIDLINDLRIGDKWLNYTQEDSETIPDPDCSNPNIRLISDFHKPTPWKKCEILVFLIHLALASKESAPAEPAVRQTLTQSFAFDPIRGLLATRESRAEIALHRADLNLCGTAIAGAECFSNPGGSIGFFRNDISPRKWNLPLGWYLPSASFDLMRAQLTPQSIFDYRRSRQVAETDLGMFVYHFDLDLYKPNASPSIGDLMPSP
jgi:hypothetical protein